MGVFRTFALATTAAAVIIVAGIIYVVTRSDNQNYLALNLAISAAERADGPEAERVKLPPNTGLQITLTIPESARGAKDYVARLAGGNGTDLEIAERTDKTVTVKVPAKLLRPGTFAIQLSKVKPDNTPERIPGNYYFAVE